MFCSRDFVESPVVKSVTPVETVGTATHRIYSTRIPCMTQLIQFLQVTIHVTIKAGRVIGAARKSHEVISCLTYRRTKDLESCTCSQHFSNKY